MTAAGAGAATAGRARLVSLEVRGFRAFGAEPRMLQLDEPLVVLHAGNSQGKTSLAEAIEFLISGRSSRRELLGGAKAEYNDSLRNAHLPDGDTDVYVEAMLRGADGVTHQVRRELLSDFGQGSECDSRLLVDAAEVDDLAAIGVELADPPARAPVLLQHTLRHVLSTEPKQRVGYFKALLSLTDLDYLRERVKAVRTRIEAEPPGAALRLATPLITATADTSAAAAGTTITTLTKKPVTAAVASEAINRALLDAGLAIVGEPTPDGGNRASVDDRAHEHNADGGRIATVDELARVVDDALATQREQTFPLAPFATGSAAVEAPPAPDLSNYATALAAADQQAARLTPVLDALLAVGDYAALDEPVQCPVCGTEHALTADRVALLREHLQQTQAVDGAARAAARALGDARRDLDQVAADAERAGPRVAGWSNEQHDRADEMLGALGIDSELLSGARSAGRALADAAEGIVQAITLARAAVDDATRAVASRDALPGQLADRYSQVARTVQALAAASQPYSGAVAVLRGAIDTAARDRVTVRGLTELADLLSGRGELVSDVVAEAARQSTIKRITAGEKALRDHIVPQLRNRFVAVAALSLRCRLLRNLDGPPGWRLAPAMLRSRVSTRPRRRPCNGGFGGGQVVLGADEQQPGVSLTLHSTISHPLVV